MNARCQPDADAHGDGAADRVSGWGIYAVNNRANPGGLALLFTAMEGELLDLVGTEGTVLLGQLGMDAIQLLLYLSHVVGFVVAG